MPKQISLNYLLILIYVYVTNLCQTVTLPTEIFDASVISNVFCRINFCRNLTQTLIFRVIGKFSSYEGVPIEIYRYKWVKFEMGFLRYLDIFVFNFLKWQFGQSKNTPVFGNSWPHRS